MLDAEALPEDGWFVHDDIFRPVGVGCRGAERRTHVDLRAHRVNGRTIAIDLHN